jgi:hypothetical protein
MMNSFSLLLIISLLVAISGLGRVVVFGPLQDVPVATVMYWTFGPAAIWLLSFILGLIIHGKRGLWLLVGAPFALLLPAVLVLVYLICGLGIQRLGPPMCP